MDVLSVSRISQLPKHVKHEIWWLVWQSRIARTHRELFNFLRNSEGRPTGVAIFDAAGQGWLEEVKEMVEARGEIPMG